MTDKCWRWKKRSEWDEFFKELGKLEKMVDDMVKDSAKDFEKEWRKFPSPYVFGFSVSIGPDGRPQVQRFGSLQSALQGAQVEKDNEPLLDVMDLNKEILVIAEFHGVDKDDIKLDVSESTLRISIDTPERSFYRNLCLPAKVHTESIQTSYKNGVLEVRLKKASRRLLTVKRHLISRV